MKISLLQWNYRKITVNRKIDGEIPGCSIARYPVNFCNFTEYRAIELPGISP